MLFVLLIQKHRIPQNPSLISLPCATRSRLRPPRCHIEASDRRIVGRSARRARHENGDTWVGLPNTSWVFKSPKFLVSVWGHILATFHPAYLGDPSVQGFLPQLGHGCNFTTCPVAVQHADVLKPSRLLGHRLKI